jgi:rod shape determining protein RodA
MIERTLWAFNLLVRRIDGWLFTIVLCILSLGLVSLYSAAYDMPARFADQLRNIGIAMLVMWFVAQVPPQLISRFAMPLYAVGIALLIAVAMFGLVKKGARRWVNVGIVIQPSEIMKIAVPLMLAWYFHQREMVSKWSDYLISAGLLIVPVGLIARQPDLGTSILVLSSGCYVIFFAGIPWKVLAALFVAGAGSLPLLWGVMHDYQRERVMTLLDPTTDPLGKGFHIIQSTIAVGSGGTAGKGWLNGTQTHLEFIPERHTDFIFAVYSEEFGLLGNGLLLALYVALVARGFIIAANATSLFGRLLAGALTMMFFTYAFVNMGMVSGILPVVGVPLPFMSYGGTALVTLFWGVGMLMAIQTHKKTS